MRRKIITTGDGSNTIYIEDWNEHYHSKHGAINEAYHVFIENGLKLFKDREIDILEIGLGTGLNTLITLIESEKSGLKINYTGVEAYPISTDELEQLNYIESLGVNDFAPHFEKMHNSAWESTVKVTDIFSLRKQKTDFFQIDCVDAFDLVYFDAFGARVQPELWTTKMFGIMYAALKSKGVLVTYAAKGSVRRAMQEVGLKVERLPGPPGKREMLRASKP